MIRYFGCALTLIIPLTACTLQAGDESDPDDGRYHERSFELGNDEDPIVVAGRARVTELTQHELSKEIESLAPALTTKEFRAGLSKPRDFGCDLVQLALFLRHGTLRVAGKEVVSADILRKTCRAVASDEPTTDAAARRTQAQTPPAPGAWPSSEVDDRQYPYKMIGRSWHNFDITVYKSTGAETEFQKRRSRGWWDVTAWWGLNADRIGIRTYYFDCPSVPEGNPLKGVCFGAPGRPASSDWQSNDDYIGERDMAVSAAVSFNLRGWLPTGLKGVWDGHFQVNVVPGYDPYERVVTYTTAPDVPAFLAGIGELHGMSRQDVADWLSNSWIPHVPDLDRGPTVTISNAALGMHSVNHGSMRFRAISSSGLGGRTTLVTSATLYEFVEW